MICRICGASLVELLTLKDIPNAAQNLPSSIEESLLSKCDLKLCECDGCRLIQHPGEPVCYFRDVIRATAYSEEMKAFRIEQLEDFVKSYGLEGKSALEIGCGAGEYLSLLNAVGLKAIGIESNSSNVEKCIKSGMQTAQGYIGDEASIKNLCKSSTFFSFNYFEHLPDLKNVLRNLKKYLKPDAIGLIEVPNFDMILQQKLLSELALDHIFYFTQSTLENTLSNCGFEIISCDRIWHDYILSATVKMRRSTDIGNLANFKEKLNSSFEEFLSDKNEGEIAVWGAGHQSLTVLSMLSSDIIKRIEFVVDSAPFKQGKFTPVTGFEIVSPEELFGSNVEAVVVIAAAYNDEIAKLICQSNSDIIVGLLRDTFIEVVD